MFFLKFQQEICGTFLSYGGVILQSSCFLSNIRTAVKLQGTHQESP